MCKGATKVASPVHLTLLHCPGLQVVSSLYARLIPDAMATNAQIFAMLQLNVALHYGAPSSVLAICAAAFMCTDLHAASWLAQGRCA